MKFATFTRGSIAAAAGRAGVLTTAFVLSGGAIAHAQTFHDAVGNYSVTVISGPIDSVGFNGSIAEFIDLSNQITLSSNTGASTALNRAYQLLFTPDPGFQFTGSTRLGAAGQGRADTGVFSAGPMTYTLGGTSGELTPHSAGNQSYNVSMEFNFDQTGIPTPANGFSLFFNTALSALTDPAGGNVTVSLHGNSTTPDTFQVAPQTIGASAAPEPGTVALLFAGTLSLAAVMARRRGASSVHEMTSR